MSFDKELKAVMISALGILAYLAIASGVIALVYNAELGPNAIFVAWLVIMLIPVNFILCALLCIIFYRRKERNYAKIREQLNELNDLAIECEKTRIEKSTPLRVRASSE